MRSTRSSPDSVQCSTWWPRRACPPAVLEAQGSILTAKYADGYPGHREYDSCQWVDEIEDLAIARAKRALRGGARQRPALFGCQRQLRRSFTRCASRATRFSDSTSGTADTRPSTRAETSAGRNYRAFAYHVRREDRLVDMEEVAALARRHRPKVLFAGWSCYSRHLDFGRFREIADDVGAALVVDMAHIAGLVAARLHPDPVPFADVCTMTVHKTLGGARGGAILCRRELAERSRRGRVSRRAGLPASARDRRQGRDLQTRRDRRVPGADARGRWTGRGRWPRLLVEAEDRTKAHVVTGGTDVHQFLVDLAPGGREGWATLHRLNGIGLSANAIALRLRLAGGAGLLGFAFRGDCARVPGFGREQFEEVGRILVDALANGGEDADGSLRARVETLTGEMPLYRFLG